MSIAVVIPTYNRARTLARAIDSVVAQSHKPEEIIVVDDGSDDCTRDVAGGNERVTYLRQKNCGVSAARNVGIRASKSRWIAFLDDDDEWLPNKLQVQREQLAASTKRICHTEEIWIRNGRRVNPMRKHAKYGGWIYQRCLPLCAMSPSSVLVDRELLEEVGLFDETLPACEDYDLWLRISAVEPVLFVREPLVRKYGGHADQLSRKFYGMDRFRICALEKMLESSVLGAADRAATVAQLVKKAAVYANGARKRGRIAEAAEYDARVNFWRHSECDSPVLL